MTQEKSDKPEKGSIEEQIKTNKGEADALEEMEEDFKPSPKGTVGSSKAGPKPVRKAGKKAKPDKKIVPIPTARHTKDKVETSKEVVGKSPSTKSKAEATGPTKSKKKAPKPPAKKKKIIEVEDGHRYSSGMESCSLCGLDKGNTTSECFGRPLFPVTQLKFDRGMVDFKDGRWTTVDKS